MVKETLDQFKVVIPLKSTGSKASMYGQVKSEHDCDVHNVEILKENGDLYVRDTSNSGVICLPFDEYRKTITQTSSSPGRKLTYPALSLYYGSKLKDLEGLCVDLGCGNGDFLIDVVSKLARDKLSLCGIDIDEKALEIARERTQGNPRYRFINRDMLDTGLDNNSVDFVTANSSLSYVGWPKLAMREIARILKSGSDVFIVDSYHNTGDYKRWLKEEGFCDVRYRGCSRNNHFLITATKK